MNSLVEIADTSDCCSDLERCSSSVEPEQTLARVSVERWLQVVMESKKDKSPAVALER